ncbi:general secretion pathway protein GspE [Oceanidesulfovibrio marinus]|uniref:General secretion pathway protein GspE n=2 Tax=Oceanidesulfovibrio marinus TaxID=370038 RepID=A0A6P1ZBD8_9BACT|nr:general secretion pathway protein GspE [Oceanidesulfovibrio marinus]
MQKRKTRKRLGEMLVEAEALTEEQLQDALSKHKRKGLRLGEYLIETGVLDEARIIEVLSKQLQIRRLDYDSFVPNPELAGIVPFEIAQRHKVVPLSRQGSVLWVAVQDPTDISALDGVMQFTRLEVETVICNREELNAIGQAIYDAKLDVEQSFEEIADDVYVDEDDDDEGDLSIGSLQSQAEDAPVVKIINTILIQALQKRASDIHLSQGPDRVILRYRVDGDLHDQPSPPRKLFTAMVSRIKLLSNLDISVTRIPQDGRFTYRVQEREISVRTSTLPTIYGEKVVMRLHVQSKRNLELHELGMSDRERQKIEAASLKPHGMILATGPTGSGKTTLLYSLLHKISKPNINIVTLEDPVETRLPGITQVQLNTKAGMTFASGLRSILRQDPDVIMVGEIRDRETANIGIESAMTGHQVFSTLHTNDAAGAVTRFIEMEIEPFLIASTLLVVVAQRLVRRICPDCIEPYEAPPQALRAMGVSAQQKMHFFRGKGCIKCSNTGYRGRLGVYEVLEIDDQVQDLILRKASSVEIKRAAIASKKLNTLKMDAAFKVFQGLTTFDEFTTVAF